ncbi:MAG TPA: rhodanese-like domain-containing protein [Lacibacter sp.]|nr:rhodanese-like domain-containing protein [Lacibacter sp.]HMO88210.1 rhodanese-like domain-containing protein [Lacibacter sp.]HMP88100.1 rhodanese-like domain-containing protein [Lacibacter sp.]
MIGLLKRLFAGGPKTDFKALVANGAIVVDVRTPGEYKSGHIKGSLNMPVDSIRGKVSELKKKGKPVITCCRSGARSGMAAGILKQNGIEAYNGGPWHVLGRQLQES